MNDRNLWLWFVMLFSITGIGGTAMGGTMTAQLNRTEAHEGERVFVEVVITGSVKGEIKQPAVKGLTLERTGTASNFTWTNGKTTAQVRYTYTVFPDRAGTYTIGSFRATIDGQKMKTLPLKLVIKAGSPRPGQGQLGQRGQRQPNRRQGSKQGSNPADLADNIFIEREISNPNPYVGEQVISTIRIFHQTLRGGNPKVTASPLVRRFPVPGEREYQRRYRGQTYNVLELKEVIVPIQSGTITVPPYILQARLYRPMGQRAPNVFDMLRGGNFNFTQELEVDVSSDPLPLRVKPLPTQGKPSNFSGLVGQFNAGVSFEKKKLEVGDSTNLKITINGRGLLDGLGKLPLPQLAALGKVYPDAPQLDETTDPNRGIKSNAIYSFAVVPEQVGNHNLGSFELSYFDPTAEQYKTLRRPLGVMEVRPSSQQEKAPVLVGRSDAGGVLQQQVAVVGQDLVGLHRDHNLLSRHDLGGQAYLELALFGGMPLLCLFGLVGFKMRRKLGQVASGKESGARAFKRFQQGSGAAVGLVNQEPGEAVSALKRAFSEFVCATMELPPGVLTPKEIKTHLGEAGIAVNLVDQVSDVLAELNRLEFSPMVADPERVKGMADKMRQLAQGIAASKNGKDKA